LFVIYFTIFVTEVTYRVEWWNDEVNLRVLPAYCSMKTYAEVEVYFHRAFSMDMSGQLQVSEVLLP
jgi:hypothetical protein